MLERYSNKEMIEVWSEQHKLDTWLAVAVAVANVSYEHGVFKSKPFAKGLANIKAPSPSFVRNYELQTSHDVAAFILSVMEVLEDEDESANEIRRFFCFGMTSSDLVDTAQSIRILESHWIMDSSFDRVNKQLSKFIEKTKGIGALGRTHGQAAERIEFNSRFIRIQEDLSSARKQFDVACREASLCMLSGPTGRYAILPEWVETDVAEQFNLTPAFLYTTSSQVLPRRLILDVIFSLAKVASAIESAALQIRLLAQTEVGEVAEMFGRHQYGSNSMPHKKNPVRSENLCGLASYVKALVAPVFGGTSLWYERDISHSSVERIALPDAFLATDYMLTTFENVIENLVVNEDRIKENLDNAKPKVFSHELLCWLINYGYNRSYAHLKLRLFMEAYDEKFDEDIFVSKFLSEFELGRGTQESFDTRKKEIFDIVRSSRYEV